MLIFSVANHLLFKNRCRNVGLLYRIVNDVFFYEENMFLHAEDNQSFDYTISFEII